MEPILGGQADASKEPKRTIVLYGTSLTAGPWSELFAREVQKSSGGRTRCVNAAMPGRASRTGLDMLGSRVLAEAPDLVLLEFAINDATQVYEESDRDYRISLEESRANLLAMIAEIRRARPDARIIIQTMNPAWDAPNGRLSASLRPRLDEYYDGYRQVAREQGLELIDHHRVWCELRGSDEELFRALVPDGVHPDELGGRRMTLPGVLAALGMESTKHE